MTAVSQTFIDTASTQARMPEQTINLPKLRILIIDDSRFSRALIISSLSSLGMKSQVEVKDAVEGIKVLTDKEQKIDLVLVDNEMPILSGAEFTKLVRRASDMDNPEIPIIMISGRTDQKHIVEARNAGIDEFLAKPFSTEALLVRIREAVLNPRPFIYSKTYVGPCRRIDQAAIKDGVEKRSRMKQ